MRTGTFKIIIYMIPLLIALFAIQCRTAKPAVADVVAPVAEVASVHYTAHNTDTIVHSLDPKAIKQAVSPAVQQALSPVLNAAEHNTDILLYLKSNSESTKQMTSQLKINTTSVNSLLAAFQQERQDKLTAQKALKDERLNRSKEKGDMLTEIRGLRAELKGGQFQHDGTNLSFYQVAFWLFVLCFGGWVLRLGMSVVTRRFFPEFYQHFKPDFL